MKIIDRLQVDIVKRYQKPKETEISNKNGRSETDTIEISRAAKEALNLSQKESAGDVKHLDKVEKLRKEIKQGTYRVSSDALATKMLEPFDGRTGEV